MTAWVFVRGLVRESAHWGDFPQAFAAAHPDASITFVDLPGNGAHHRARAPLSVHAMTEAVREEASSVTRPFVLSLSLGGMVACDWAQRYPDEVSGVIFVNTSFGGFSPPHHRFRAGAVLPTLRSMRERNAYRREHMQLKITSSRPELHDHTAARWAGVARARPVSRENGLRQLVAAARFRAPRTPPSVPHLVLCGGGDRLVDPRCSRTIAERWAAPYFEHPTAGHDLTLDAPNWMLENISAWLKSLPVA